MVVGALYGNIMGKQFRLQNFIKAWGPLLPPRECESASAFFKRMSKLDEKLSNLLNEKRNTVVSNINAKRKVRKPFHEGDLVWYLRPTGEVGTNLQSWWLGPCKVISRVSNSNYQILVKPGIFQEVHLDQLKPYIRDIISGKPTALFEFRGGYKPVGVPTGEGWIENILQHRKNVQGIWEFLVHWRGNPPSEDSWEPSNALSGCNSLIYKEYCTAFGIPWGPLWIPSAILPDELLPVR